MRTTVTIDDNLLAEAKAIAARSHQSVGSVLEDALREQLARRSAQRDEPFDLPTFGSHSDRPLVDLDDKDALAQALGDNDPLW